MNITALKIKTATTLGFLILFTFLLSLQVTNSANAINAPMTSPITNPITSPITGPVIGNFSISGNVKYHILAFFARNSSQFSSASGVTVKAEKMFSTHSVSTTADSNGNYILPAGQAGLYKVSVSGGEARFYVPPIKMVTDNKPAGQTNVNFQGMIFKKL